MYSVVIRETSKELTKKESIALKTSTFISLDKAAPITIHPTAYAVMDVHNDETEQQDYTKYVIFADEGNFATGSEAFFRTFKDIFTELYGSDEEWGLEVIKQDSRKREGKYFLTCAVI